MNEIVKRLQENREIERAKEIIESAGYKVSTKMNESGSIYITKPDDLVGHNPKFRVVYSPTPRETSTVTIEATDERSARAIITGRCRRLGKTPKFISIEKVSESEGMDEAAPVFVDSRTSIDIRGLAQVDREELLNDYAGAIEYKDGIIYADETTIRQIRNDWDLWESKEINESAPARNGDSSREEKLAYARELLEKAKDSSGDADDSMKAAWELVDFLWDTMLLKESTKMDESLDSRKFASMYAYLEDEAYKSDRSAKWLEEIDKEMMKHLPGLSDDVAKDFDNIKDEEVKTKLYNRLDSLVGGAFTPKRR